MSNIKELIRAEIRKWRSIVEERCPESTRSRDYTKEEWNAIYEYNAYTRILSFLDTLPDEPEQPTRGYDEAYLNEKIAKASKTWKGVDVDKFMDEIRGREPVSNCHDLKEAAEKSARQYYVDGGYSPFPNMEMASHIAGFKAGAEWMAKQGVSYQATISADKTIPVLPMKDVSDMGLDYGDKVRIIILPEEG